MLKQNIFIVIITVLFISCTAQETNPKYIGNEILDLDKITFNESIDTLFSKVLHRKLPITDGYYDVINKKTVITDTLAFDVRISKKTPNQPLFYFLDKKFTEDYLVDFYTDSENNFKAISFSSLRKESYNDVLNMMRNKYKKHEVYIKKQKKLEIANTKAYQWETENKIIVMYLTDKDSEGDYICGISVLKKEKNMFNINQVIPGLVFCLDKSCKE